MESVPRRVNWKTTAEDREWATEAAVSASIQQNAEIISVNKVDAHRDVLRRYLSFNFPGADIGGRQGQQQGIVINMTQCGRFRRIVAVIG